MAGSAEQKPTTCYPNIMDTLIGLEQVKLYLSTTMEVREVECQGLVDLLQKCINVCKVTFEPEEIIKLIKIELEKAVKNNQKVDKTLMERDYFDPNLCLELIISHQPAYVENRPWHQHWRGTEPYRLFVNIGMKTNRALYLHPTPFMLWIEKYYVKGSRRYRLVFCQRKENITPNLEVEEGHVTALTIGKDQKTATSDLAEKSPPRKGYRHKKPKIIKMPEKTAENEPSQIEAFSLPQVTMDDDRRARIRGNVFGAKADK